MNCFNLNERQRLAAEHHNGPMMVLAGPGSGKTTVITYRIYNLLKIHNVEPGSILAITFTKAAATEMSRRLSLMGVSENVSVNTFHSIFFRIMKRRYDYAIDGIMSDDERMRAIKTVLTDMHLHVSPEFAMNTANEISLVKNDMFCLDTYYSINMGEHQFRDVYNKYEEYKEKIKKIDFDDMLTKCYEAISSDNEYLKFLQSKYRYILIDEFQDINRIQYENIKLLTEAHKNIFVVGDDDQSIYRFRGARPEFLLNFQRDFPDTKKLVLNVNYRSTEQIVNFCRRVIQNNKIRFDKDLQGTGRNGQPPSFIQSNSMRAEAVKIGRAIDNLIQAGEDINEVAVIYRINAQAPVFIDSLVNLNIPFTLKDVLPVFYEHWISADILAYFNLAVNREDSESLIRIINKPSRFISKQAVINSMRSERGAFNELLFGDILEIWQKDRLEELRFQLAQISRKNAFDAIKYIRQKIGYDKYLNEYANYKNINPDGLFEILNQMQEETEEFESVQDFLEHTERVIENAKKVRTSKNSQSEGVTLTTMHSAKGLEYNTVFVTGVNEGLVPHEKSKSDVEIEEERRLLYVGITRAKSNLIISLVKKRHDKEALPSRFIEAFLKQPQKKL